MRKEIQKRTEVNRRQTKRAKVVANNTVIHVNNNNSPNKQKQLDIKRIELEFFLEKNHAFVRSDCLWQAV